MELGSTWRWIPRKSRVAAATAVAVLAAVVAAHAAPPIGYALSWADEFEGTALNTTNWGYRQLGARALACNVTNAVSVGGGALTISTYTRGGTNFTGMIGTQGKFEQTRGYWEARIDFDSSPGMQSAFWVQSPTYGNPIGNPAVAGTEMDVMEHRATNASGTDISDTAHHAVHWDGYGASHQQVSSDTGPMGLASGFHTYGMLWTETNLQFFVDGVPTWTGGAVSERPEYAILSSEVKGGWSGSVPSGGYGDLGVSQTRMVVDYVRVYQAVPEPATGTGLAMGALFALVARVTLQRHRD